MEKVSARIAPFDDLPGTWLRTALHVHTSESDGWLIPARQRRFHTWGGYDVLAITDHDMLTEFPEGTDDLVLIGGTEISLVAPKTGGPLHVLGIGITTMPAVSQSNSLSEAALAIREAGGLSFLAHPVWSGLRTDEVNGLEHCAGVEIFNSSCEVEQGRGHNDAHTDVWLSMGHRLTLIATDDTHYPGYDSFHSWINLHARDRSREAVMDALAAGRFYASSGPRITDIAITNDTVEILCSPVRSVAFIANPPHGGMVSSGRLGVPYRGRRLRTTDGHALEGIADGETLTGATFPITRNMRWGRVVLTDFQGRRAWSNPIWFV